MSIDTTHPRSASTALTGGTSRHSLTAIDYVALALMIIGSLNWGLVGAFNVDLVAMLFGPMSTASRAIYLLVGVAGVYGIYLATRIARRAVM